MAASNMKVTAATNMEVTAAFHIEVMAAVVTAGHGRSRQVTAVGGKMRHSSISPSLVRGHCSGGHSSSGHGSRVMAAEVTAAE